MLTSIYSADHDCHSLLVPLTTTATTLIPLLLTATLCHHHSLLTIQPLLPPLTTTNHHYHHHRPWAAHSRNPAWPRHLSFVPYLSIWHLENPEWCFGKEQSLFLHVFLWIVTAEFPLIPVLFTDTPDLVTPQHSFCDSCLTYSRKTALIRKEIKGILDWPKPKIL